MQVITNICVLENNKILMVQEAWGNVKGMWNFPAGHLDENENVFDGAIREAKEETGYDVELTGILGIQNYITKDRHHMHIIFAAKVIGGQVRFDPNEIMAVDYIEAERLLDMDDKELRGAKLRKSTIKKLLANKIYPLELIENFDER